MASTKPQTGAPSLELLEDLCARFILTAPAESLQEFEGMMFLVEQAHWYYEDFVRQKYPELRTYKFHDFAKLLFANCRQLSKHVANIDKILRKFKDYKMAVPVMGAILLDRSLDRVLLVRGFKSGSCWGFPRGKISKDETDVQCAVREVWEETSFDIEPYVKEKDFIQIDDNGKRIRLFIIPGLNPDKTRFSPHCRGEIGAYAWHSVNDLPATAEAERSTFVNESGQRHKFFGVYQFIVPLRHWIQKHKRISYRVPSPTPEQSRALLHEDAPAASSQLHVDDPAASSQLQVEDPALSSELHVYGPARRASLPTPTMDPPALPGATEMPPMPSATHTPMQPAGRTHAVPAPSALTSNAAAGPSLPVPSHVYASPHMPQPGTAPLALAPTASTTQQAPIHFNGLMTALQSSAVPPRPTPPPPPPPHADESWQSSEPGTRRPSALSDFRFDPAPILKHFITHSHVTL